MALSDRFSGLRERYERLSQRERGLLGAFFVSALLMVAVIVGLFISDGLSTVSERNEQMRQALRDIDSQRDLYLKAKAKLTQVESRLPQGPMQLGSYLEAAAKDAGVQLPETKEGRPQAIGTEYMQRDMELTGLRVTLDQLAGFLRRIETGPQVVVVTQLTVRTTDSKHTDLSVDITVAAWEKVDKSKPAGGKKDKDKDKDKDKG